jgi:hypothetical protein
LLDQLLKDYQSPDDLLGEEGLLLGGMSPDRAAIVATFVNVANEVPAWCLCSTIITSSKNHRFIRR